MSRILVIGSFDFLSRSIYDRLVALEVPTEISFGHADTLQRLRMRSFGIVITSPESPIDEDLALLEEIRLIRPGVRCLLLAPHSTPDDVIAAMKARVFACFGAPFDIGAIVNLAQETASNSEWRDDIQIVSARPGWVTIRANCSMLTAERLITFARELSVRMPGETRQEMMQALREIILNAMEHGAAFNPDQVIYVTAARTARAVVFYIRDPGSGFRRSSLGEGAVVQPFDDPMEHIVRREEAGLRPGGYGLLLAGGTVDELIYNDIGNEVVLIKYTDGSVR